jgi:hypothetical protein
MSLDCRYRFQAVVSFFLNILSDVFLVHRATEDSQLLQQHVKDNIMKYIFIVFLTIVTFSSTLAQVKGGGNLQVVQPKKAKINGVPALPSIIGHQGYIADSTGTGLNGVFPMTFGFFADSTGGSAVLTQSISSVAITKGVFSVNLDVSSISFTQQYWLETSINGETLAPRTRLTSAPYSLYSVEADTAQYARASAGNSCNYTIGQLVPALGGYIFYLDPTGCHGLVCAPNDQSTGIQWYNGNYSTTNSSESGIGIGRGNTQSIVNFQGLGPYAAYLCDTLTLAGFHDWYLPSRYELNLMWLNVGPGSTNVGGFALDPYWSSTEVDNNFAWSEYFNSGSQYNSMKYGTTTVRAVRAF